MTWQAAMKHLEIRVEDLQLQMQHWNPEAKYFGLGKITEGQLKDYAKRRHISENEARKWLSPNLAET